MLLQLMLNILEVAFKFQSVKSCIVLFSKQNVRLNTTFMLGDQPLKNEGYARHLGIQHYANRVKHVQKNVAKKVWMRVTQCNVTV